MTNTLYTKFRQRVFSASRLLSLTAAIMIVGSHSAFGLMDNGADVGYGTSIPGSTGFLNVISPATVPEGSMQLGFHTYGYEFVKPNQSYNVFSIKGNYGLTNTVELGFEKSMDSSSYVDDPGIVINGKFSQELTPKLRLSVGTTIDTDANDYSSAYMVVGESVAFFGFGANFGGHSGPQSFPNSAAFGGYNFEDLRPEHFFFMAGAEFRMGIGSVLLGYNGDSVSFGFRAPVASEGIVVDFGWKSKGDYEDAWRMLPGYADYTTNPIVFGISGSF